MALQLTTSLFPYDRWGGIEPIGRAAELADELGFGALQLPDHVIMPVKTDRDEASVVWYDDFVLASHLATRTHRLRFIFNVLVVPYRPPVLLAKLVSTLDVVSGGRLTLGVGAGWLKGEFRVLGVPYAERGALTDEYLRAMKALWTQERPEFSGRTVSFSRLAFEPKCVQKPHVPLWIGGSGPAPLRRVVELGDGWSPMAGELPELARDIQWLRDAVRERGRDPDALDFHGDLAVGEPDSFTVKARGHVKDASSAATRRGPDSADEVVERAGRHQEAGFTHLSLFFAWETPADYLSRLEWIAAKVMPQLR